MHGEKAPEIGLMNRHPVVWAERLFSGYGKASASQLEAVGATHLWREI
jgi:hypothetical protein